MHVLKCVLLTSVAVVSLLCGTTLQAGVLFNDPAGGWAYTYDGATDATPSGAALDGTWDHDNGSDTWNGGRPSAPDADGGAESIDGVLRIEDAKSSDPNRKIYLTHNVEGLSGLGSGSAFLAPGGAGVTISVRSRLPASPFDIAVGPEGEFTQNNKTMWAVRSVGPNNSFAMALLHGPGNSAAGGSLIIGPNGNGNAVPIDDITQFQEIWVTILPDDVGDNATVDVYLNGSTVPTSFAFNLSDDGEENHNTIAMGSSATGALAAFDTDFYSVKGGIHLPNVIPEPSTFVLTVLGLLGLAVVRRRRRRCC